jgi:peptidyl-prolyl cis-trans isomerase SurA
MRIKVVLTVLFVIMFSASAHSHAEISNRVVAIVNNDVITLYELNKRIKELTGYSSDTLKAQSDEKFIETRRTILEMIIDEKVAQSKIQELGVQVSQEEIDSYIENFKKANNLTQEDLIAGLKDEGTTLALYRNSIKEKLEREQLIEYEVKSKSIILENQISKYYQDHIDEFREEELDQIASIVLKVQDKNNADELAELNKKGEKILARLKNGEDFSALAKEFSQGPGADEGGVLGEFNSAHIDPALKKIIGGLAEGQVSDLITTGSGIQIIKLLKRTGGAVKPFEEVRNDIYQTIYDQELEKRYSTWIKELRDKSFTKINF